MTNIDKVNSPVTYVIAGVALLLAGAIIGVFTDPYLPSSLSNTKKAYQSGFDSAKKVVESSRAGALFSKESDMRTISGTVIGIKDNKITIRDEALRNPFEVESTLNNRTVVVAATTKVMKFVEKDAKILQAERDALAKSKLTTGINPFIKSETTLSTIKIGDSVTINAGENIKNLAEFTATEVEVFYGASGR